MNPHLKSLQASISPIREEIIHHKVYAAIDSLEKLRIFTQYHVFAVWDFMSLLKALQRNLTCTTIPWFPKGTADTRFLINEIVAGEESDLDQSGNRASHYELYLEAMRQMGASTSTAEAFIRALQRSENLELSMEKAGVPLGAADFMRTTFQTIAENKDHELSAVFTFGREDLIPGMFLSMVRDLNRSFSGSTDIFRYYLERHIEVDGDEHSGLALRMTSALCGTDENKWKEAQQATIRSLESRIQLWDAAYNEIQQKV